MVVTKSRQESANPSSRASVVPPRIKTCGRMSSLNPNTIRPETIGPGQTRWLSIVGIGEDGIDGLGELARGLIESAEIVFGGSRHLALAAPLIRGSGRTWASPFDAAAGVLSHRG